MISYRRAPGKSQERGVLARNDGFVYVPLGFEILIAILGTTGEPETSIMLTYITLITRDELRLRLE